MCAESSQNSVLPPEIIDLIINCLIPTNEPLPIALPASSPVTKALLVLARTSRVTYPEAARLLYTHCLYIDSPERLHRVSRTLSILAGRIPSHTRDVHLTHCPEHMVTRPHPILPRVPSSAIVDSILWEPSARNPMLPPFEPHKHVTSIYLRPFPDIKIYEETAENLAIVHSIHDLVTLIAPTLQRLNVDIEASVAMPLGSDDPLHLVHAIRHAFQQCKNITYLCSMHGNFALLTGSSNYQEAEEFQWPLGPFQPPVWYSWSKLQTLILLYRYKSNPVLWTCVSLMPSVTNFVLLRPVGVNMVDNTGVWRKAVANNKHDPARLLTVYVVMAEGRCRDPLLGPSEYMEGTIRVREIEVPNPDRVENLYDLCEGWIRRTVFSGKDPADWSST